MTESTHSSSHSIQVNSLGASRQKQATYRRLLLILPRYAAILLILIVFLTPFAWMLLSSFKSQIDIINPDHLLNFQPTLENYEDVFQKQNFLAYMGNTFFVAAASTIFSLILGLPAAYGIARFHTGWIGILLLTARMVPGITFLIPWYLVFSRLNLTDSFIPLILSHMLVGLPFVTWVMIPFFESLPVETEESARIDGATPFEVFLRIALPLSVPGIITSAIIAFIFSWNNFMFSLVLAGDDTKTLPIAIFNFVGYGSISWGSLMAAAVVITMPVLVISLFVQRYIIAGLTAGAVK